tara:strand:- start:521 stop:946 length:426 start_codon:yes stop_codon:yes gene_type:complete
MNKRQVMITLPINIAHLMSLSGMLREYAPDKVSLIFCEQVYQQAELQGIELDKLTIDDYELMSSKTMDFTIPTICVADVGKILMNVSKQTADSKNITTAIDVLIQNWTPFVVCAMEAHGLGKQAPHAHNRLTDYGFGDRMN